MNFKQKFLKPSYLNELLKLQKEGYLVTESIAYINKGKDFANPNFCQGKLKMEMDGY